MRKNKKILLILFLMFLGGFSNNASAIDKIDWSPKTKTFLWGGGAALSAVFGLYFLNQAQKCRTMLADPTLSEDERAATLGKLSRCYAFAGACLAGTVFTGAMTIKNGFDWKNGKEGGEDGESDEAKNNEIKKTEQELYDREQKLYDREQEAKKEFLRMRDKYLEMQAAVGASEKKNKTGGQWREFANPDEEIRYKKIKETDWKAKEDKRIKRRKEREEREDAVEETEENEEEGEGDENK
jgi:hypothetical protein